MLGIFSCSSPVLTRYIYVFCTRLNINQFFSPAWRTRCQVCLRLVFSPSLKVCVDTWPFRCFKKMHQEHTYILLFVDRNH